MYNGYVESQEQIARRKARILAGYKPAKRTAKGRARKPSQPVEIDRLMFALAQKRMYADI